MTFEEAVLKAAKSVTEAPTNLAVSQYHASVQSLVVRTVVGEYFAITVELYRANQSNSQRPGLEVILTLAGRDGFDG